MSQIPNFNKLVLLQGFCNYFDRKIFYYSDYEDYIAAASAYYIQSDINFNPNDGVEATVDLSSLDSSMDESVVVHEFSYLIVLDTSNNIVSRWFIMEIVRTTNGIYRFTLRRDVVAEARGNLTFKANAPIYIEKAELLDSDPMIVNDEGMRLNQIKQSELLISDALLDDQNMGDQNLGYIVGYFASNASAVTANTHPKQTPTSYVTLATIASATGITLTDLGNMTNGSYAKFVTSGFSVVFGAYTNFLSWAFKIEVVIPQTFSNVFSDYSYTDDFAWNWDHSVFGIRNPDHEATKDYADMIALHTAGYFMHNNTLIKTAIQNVVQNDFAGENIYTNDNYSKLQAYENSIVEISGRYYYMHIKTEGITNHPEIKITQNENTLFDGIPSYVIGILGDRVVEYPDWEMYLNYKNNSVRIELEEVPSYGVCQVTIPQTHRVLTDAPYSMFVIPYGYIRQTRYQGLDVSSDRMSKLEALDLANDIALKLDASLLDLQLLPFMPERSKYLYSSQEWAMDLHELTEDKDYAVVTRLGTPNTKAGAVLFPEISSFSYTIPYRLDLKHSMKIDSQCCFYRLCSPNYNGIFEFNLAKLGGSSSFFSIDCTLKPFNPFIRITPEFNFLYGSNFKDGRGLICGGDFSLPIMKDAWINYELNNKNYSSIFSREIQNLDFTQGQERFKEKFTLTAGALGAGAAGAVAGAKGGVYGAIAGAAVGTTAGIAGGIIDATLNERRRAEEKDFAIDRFNMSLANIKALPQSLTRSTSYSVISKIFPFLEFYTCTDEEVKALKNKIKYDGMTVGRIGVIGDYMGGNDNLKFFKGELIRAEGILDDDHFVKVLYNELAKGVYI